jgi:hypothetical protein
MAQGRRDPINQATAVEQSRAVAEVQAAVVVAQRCPRNEITATTKVIESCGQRAVAETAFYKFPRGGSSVTGESVHLARELARCWGNISYGISELSRDDEGGNSEMLAFAWDLETNAQSRMTFQVPHKRDKRGGPEVLTDMRDIYENNANMGARRLRECIFAVLPPYLKEKAKAACIRTLEEGDSGKPLPVRIGEALVAFEKIGISKERLEAKFNKATSWSAMDVAQMEVSYRSINRREVNAEDEFPRVGTEETTKVARNIADQSKPAQQSSADDHREGPADEQMGEAHSGADDLDNSIEAVTARNITAQANAVIDQQGLTEVEALAAKHRALIDAHDASLMPFVDAAIDAAETRLTKKG